VVGTREVYFCSLSFIPCDILENMALKFCKKETKMIAYLQCNKSVFDKDLLSHEISTYGSLVLLTKFLMHISLIRPLRETII
jgi:hypothetical protein